MIYDCLFEISDSALNPFEMIYDYRFEMTATKIFVHKTIFVNRWKPNPRDENDP